MEMGNSSCKSQTCDCGSTPAAISLSRAGTCPGSKPSLLVADVVAVSKTVAEQKGLVVTKARVRSISLGENVALDMVGESKILHNHSYNLRPRHKDGFRPNETVAGYDAKPKSLKADIGQCTVNNELLEPLEELSLVHKTNIIDDHNQPELRTKCTSLERAEDIELPKHVLYYGWFFSTETSSVIYAVIMHYFRLCYTEVPQFQRFMLTCCKDTDIKDPFEYYKRPGKKVKPDDPIEYHVTAKFLGREPNHPYQTLVQPFLLKTFRIYLVGLIFTPRTLGVRVRLTPAQQLLFDEKDEPKNGQKLAEQQIKSTEIRKQIQEEIDGYTTAHKLHRKTYPKCKVKMKTLPSGNGKDGIIFRRIHQDPTVSMTTQSRAHITIGCAPNVKAKQTGDDLLDVIDLEQRPATTGNSNFQQDFKIKGGVLRQFGKHADAFALYADTEMIVPCQFNLFI